MGTMNVTMPDGTVIKGVPDDMTKEQLMRRYDRHQNPEPSLMDQLASRGTALADTLADFAGLTQREADILGEAPARRELGAVEAGVQVAGTVAGGALDTMGEAFSALVPDALGDWTTDQVADFFQTDAGQQVGSMIMSGMKTWEEFEKENPQMAKTIGSAANLAMLVTPTPKGMKTAAKKAGSKISKAGEATAKMLESSAGKSRKKAAQKLLTSDGQTGLGKHGENIVRGAKYTPHSQEQKMIDALATVKEYKPGRSVRHNLGAAEDAIARIGDDIVTELGKAPKKTWNMRFVEKKLGGIHDDLSVLPGYHALGMEDSKIVKNVTDEALKILSQQEGRGPLDMHRARQAFDAAMKINGKAPSADSAKGIAWKHVRDLMNKHVDHAGGAEVARLRGIQHGLKGAHPILRDKAEKEAQGAIRRIVKTAFKEGHLPTTVGALASLAFIPGAAPVALGAAGAVSAYGTARAITSSQARKGYAQMIRAIDKAMKDPSNKKALAALRADRAIILELMQDAYVPTQATESEPED